MNEELFGEYGTFESMIDTLINDAMRYQFIMNHGVKEHVTQQSIQMNTIRDDILKVWELNNLRQASKHALAIGEVMLTLGTKIKEVLGSEDEDTENCGLPENYE